LKGVIVHLLQHSGCSGIWKLYSYSEEKRAAYEGNKSDKEWIYVIERDWSEFIIASLFVESIKQ
jgi:hypothetical protein